MKRIKDSKKLNDFMEKLNQLQSGNADLKELSFDELEGIDGGFNTVTEGDQTTFIFTDEEYALMQQAYNDPDARQTIDLTLRLMGLSYLELAQELTVPSEKAEAASLILSFYLNQYL